MGSSTEEAGRQPLHRQRTQSLVGRNIPLLVGFGGIAVGTVGATLSMIRDFQADPSTPVIYYLLPIVVWFAFLEAFLVAGAELSRSRFAVWKDAFAPPFRRPRTLAKKLPPIIPFGTVERVVPGSVAIRGEEQLFSVSVELRNGERLLVRAGDVGREGAQSLLDAWSAWAKERAEGISHGTLSETPPWVGREWREEAIIGVLLLVFLALIAVVLFAAGNPASVAGIAYLSLASLGAAFAIGYIASARARARRIAKTYEYQFKERP